MEILAQISKEMIQSRAFTYVLQNYGTTMSFGLLTRALLMHSRFKGKIPIEIIKKDVDFEIMIEVAILHAGDEGFFVLDEEFVMPPMVKSSPTTTTKTLGFLEKLIEEYKKGFEQRYGIVPFLTKQDEHSLKEITQGIGEQRAMELISKYCSYDNPYYVARKHPIMLLRADINKVMVEINNPKAASESRIAKEQLDRDAIKYGRDSRIRELEKKIEENRIREKAEATKKEEVVVVREESVAQRKLTAEEIKIPGFVNRGA